MVNFLQQAPRDSRLTLIGAVMCFSGLGTLAVWTNINIYLFSYYTLNNNSVSLKIFNTVISLTALIGALMSLVALRIAERFGQILTIRVCMIVYPLAIVISAFQTNVWAFAFFYSIVVGVASGISMMPLIHCTYAHFGKENTGNVTGISMGCFGLSTMFYVFLTTFVINPRNDSATIEYHEGHTMTNIFAREVAQNVPHGILAMGILCFILTVPGSLLLRRKEDRQKKDYEALRSISSTPCCAFGSTDCHCGNCPTPNGGLALCGTRKDTEVVLYVVDQERSGAVTVRKEAIQRGVFVAAPNACNGALGGGGGSGGGGMGDMQGAVAGGRLSDGKGASAAKPFDLKKFIHQRSFQLLFLTSTNVSLQIFFISLNFKVYGNQKINDDLFLTTTLIVSQFIAAMSKFVWGYLIDKYYYKHVLYVSLTMGGLFTATLPLIAHRHMMYLIWYTLITVCERGFLTVGPPILVKFYDVEEGTQLIPAYQTAFLLGIIAVPIFQIPLLKIMTFDSIFVLSGLLVVVTNFFVTQINDRETNIGKYELAAKYQLAKSVQQPLLPYDLQAPGVQVSQTKEYMPRTSNHLKVKE